MLQKFYLFIASFLICCAATHAYCKEEISARDFNARGIYNLEKGDNRMAENDFRKAIAIDPGIKHYYNNLAVSCMKQGKFDEAYKYLSICISMDNGYARALSNMAIASFRLFKFREAYGYYTRALSVDEENTKMRFERNRVIGQLRKLIKEEPDNKSLVEILNHLEKKGIFD